MSWRFRLSGGEGEAALKSQPFLYSSVWFTLTLISNFIYSSQLQIVVLIDRIQNLRKFKEKVWSGERNNNSIQTCNIHWVFINSVVKVISHAAVTSCEGDDHTTK